MPPHETNLISVHTLKTNIFRPPRKNQVNFDINTEVKLVSTLTIKSSQVWCRDTKTKLIATPTLKPSQFRSLY